MRIVVLSTDLMDRSRITAALSNAEFVRAATDVAGADVVVVDLARHADAIAAVRAAAPTARIVAFGPHVDTAALEQARTEGADVVLARSRFFQDPVAAVATG
jgi:DNA-binding NarL/FixJ family response regulator